MEGGERGVVFFQEKEGVGVARRSGGFGMVKTCNNLSGPDAVETDTSSGAGRVMEPTVRITADSQKLAEAVLGLADNTQSAANIL